MERNLLNIEITFRLTEGAIGCTTEEMKEHIRIQAGCIHKSYLHSFRKDESKPYLVWISSGCSGNGLAYVSFNIRLKSPYDEDFVVPAFRDLPHVRGIKSSWFPSRNEYGGTVQSDGTIIETWDI